MLYTKTKCLENSHLSIKFDVFTCITLPIPEISLENVNLDICFKAFMEEFKDDS